MPRTASTEPFRALAAELEAAGFIAHRRRLEAVLDGVWTTSSDFMSELGAVVSTIRKECKPHGSARRALLQDCLRQVRIVWPGFGLFSWLPFRW